MPKHFSRTQLFAGLFICGLASLFYLYDFTLRVIPSVMSQELMAMYHVTGVGFAFISTFFFIGYMLMQIPCGLLYDRYGPRRLLTLMCFIAAFSALLFVATKIFAIALFARFFMGIGSAFAYIGALVLIMRWLPENLYATSAGSIQLIGAAGAILGQAPMAYFVGLASPEYVMMYVAAVGFVLSILFWIFIRDFPPGSKHAIAKHEDMNMIARLERVLSNRQNWCIALYGFAIWAPMSVFAATWDVRFLQASEHISSTAAGLMASSIWVGVAIGGPVFGWLSDYISSRRIPLFIGATLGIISSSLLLYDPYLSSISTDLMLALFGVAASVQAVTFGAVQDNNLPHYGGTAAGFNNMAIVFGGVLLTPLVGYMLRWHAAPLHTTVPPHYLLSDYRFALSVLPLSYTLALITALFLIKETHCKQQTKN